MISSSNQRRTSGGANLTCSMENVKLIMLEYSFVVAFNNHLCIVGRRFHCDVYQSISLCRGIHQRRITSRSVDLLRESGQHQLGFSTAPLEGDCRDDVLGILPDNTCDHVHEEAAKEDSNGNVYSSGASGSSPKTRLDSDQV